MNRKAVFAVGAVWIVLGSIHLIDRIGRIRAALPALTMTASDRAAVETGDPELHRAIHSGRPVAQDATDFEKFRTAFERYPAMGADGSLAWILGGLLTPFVFLLRSLGWRRMGFPDRAGLIMMASALIIAYLDALLPRSAWSNWDAWAVWDFKTKAVLHEGWLPRAFLTNPEYAFSHPEYPLLWPWLQAAVSSIAGGFDTRALRLLPVLCAGALPFLLSATLAELGVGSGRWLIAGAVAMLPNVLEHSSNGYVDWPLATAESAALLMVLRCRRGAEPAWAVGLIAGLAANLKMEGLIFGIGLLVAWSAVPGKRPTLRPAVAVFLALALPWQLYRQSLGITPADFGLPLAQAVREMPGRTLLFLRAVLFEGLGAGPTGRTLGDWWTHLVSSWLLFWFIAGYAVLTGWRRLSEPVFRIPLVVLGVQILGAWAAYGLTIRDPQWLITTSLDRLMLQWVPSVTVIAAVLLTRKGGCGVG